MTDGGYVLTLVLGYAAYYVVTRALEGWDEILNWRGLLAVWTLTVDGSALAWLLLRNAGEGGPLVAGLLILCALAFAATSTVLWLSKVDQERKTDRLLTDAHRLFPRLAGRREPPARPLPAPVEDADAR